MKKLLYALAATGIVAAAWAWADTPLDMTKGHGEPVRVVAVDPFTGSPVITVSGGGLLVTPVPQTGSLTGQTTVSCAATTTTLLAAAAASNFVTIKNLNAAANTVWINFTGVAAVAAAPSFDLAPGSAITFASSTFLPTQQINCIASPGAQSVTLVYK